LTATRPSRVGPLRVRIVVRRRLEARRSVVERHRLASHYPRRFGEVVDDGIGDAKLAEVLRVPDPDDPNRLGVVAAERRRPGPSANSSSGATTGSFDFESDPLVSAFAYVFFMSS